MVYVYSIHYRNCICYKHYRNCIFYKHICVICNYLHIMYASTYLQISHVRACIKLSSTVISRAVVGLCFFKNSFKNPHSKCFECINKNKCLRVCVSYLHKYLHLISTFIINSPLFLYLSSSSQ